MILILPQKQYYKWLTALFCGIELLLVAWVSMAFETQLPDYQLIEQYDWIHLKIGNLGIIAIKYLLGIDGISLPLLWLTALVMLIGAIASWHINERPKAYFSLYLLLTATIMGCFVALDFFLFFLFFEFMLLPMYFLIGLWGGPRREYASIKFFIYTLVGSICILIVMIGLHLAVIDPNQSKLLGQLVHTFDIRLMANGLNYLPNSLLTPTGEIEILGLPSRMWAFWLLFIGFAIKLPIVPLHTWLPDAHVEAPTPISVVLAGVLLKVGGYGLLRFLLPIFPDGVAEYATPLSVIAVVSIVYGAYNALAQSDLKKLIAYSSVSHLGFALLGIASLTPQGINGSVFLMVSHGILSAMLFLIAGVLYDRTHDRNINNYRGLARPMPGFTFFTAIAFFASLGLPLFSGFVGELFPLMGAFGSSYLPLWVPVLATAGIVLGAAYFLWTFQKMFLGEFWTRQSAYQTMLSDLTWREQVLLVPLSVITLFLGVYPNFIFHVSEQTVAHLLKIFAS
jgi:NADH-quinone oxidoreductase subunit M